MRVLRASWFAGGVDAEHNVGDFLPCRTFGGGVEKPQIDRKMRAIVVGQLRVGRRFFSDGLRLGGAHGFVVPSAVPRELAY